METEWYDRLAEYFPPQELKDEDQMKMLLAKNPVYRTRVTDDYVLVYADFPEFVFIDYILIEPSARGKGIGSRLIQWLKTFGKPIIGEVEPKDASDTDSIRRVRFYERQGFRRAQHIRYTREDSEGRPHTMHIYYWSPDQTSELEIMEDMSQVCSDIHNFRSAFYYGRDVANPDEVLRFVIPPGHLPPEGS